MSIYFVHDESPCIEADVLTVICAEGDSFAEGSPLTGACLNDDSVSAETTHAAVPYITDVRRINCNYVMVRSCAHIQESADKTAAIADLYHNIFTRTVELGFGSVLVPLLISGEITDASVDSALSTAVKCADSFLESRRDSGNRFDVIIHLAGHRLTRRRFESVVRSSSRISLNNDLSIVPQQAFDTLDENLARLTPSFYETLLIIIEQKGMTQVECYKKANMDRRFFSRLKNTERYTPNRSKVLEMAVAMQLNLSETRTLLRAAGYDLSTNSITDVILSWHISRSIWDPEIINKSLKTYGQTQLNL